MSRSVVTQLPRSWRIAALAMLQLALAALLLLQALHLNSLAASVGTAPAQSAEVQKQAARQKWLAMVEAELAQAPVTMAELDTAQALAARLPRRPPMRAPARRTIFETVERRWKEYRLLGTQRFA